MSSGVLGRVDAEKDELGSTWADGEADQKERECGTHCQECRVRSSRQQVLH